MARADVRAAVARARPDLVGAAVATSLATGAAALYYRIWDFRPGISPSYEGDGLSYQALVQGILEGHWALHNDRLGYPYGQDTSPYPLADHVSFALVKGFGWVTGAGSAAVTTLFLFTTYALVALAAYVALRWLHVRRDTAVVLAVLYSLAPYHLERSAGHLLFSFYVMVPLATAVLVRQLDGHAAFVDPDSGRVGRHVRGSWPAVAVAALLGVTGSYFCVMFGVVALGIAILLACRGRSGLPSAGSTLALVGVAAASLVVALLPSLITSGGVHLERPAYHSELYGLRIGRLVLPSPEHRIDLLGAPARTLVEGHPSTGADGTSPLGAVAAAGFLGALVVVLQGRGGKGVHGAASTVAVVTTLVGTAAGFGTLLPAFGFTQIRAWNRISVYIAFAALVVVAGWIDAAAERVVPRRWTARAGLAALLVLALLDQATPFDPAERRETIERWEADSAFFHAVETDLPPGAAVFQLPPVPYPESPPMGEMLDYDHLRGYLHTGSLRWSYGAQRLLEPPWDLVLTERPTREIVAGAVLAGFDAVYVNQAGYADQPDPGRVARELTSLLGPPAARSRDGAMQVWDVSELRARLTVELDRDARAAARADVIDLVSVEGGDGFFETEGSPAFQWMEGEHGQLVVENRTDIEAKVNVSIRLSGIAPAEVLLSRGALVRRVAVEPGVASEVRFPLEASPGRSSIDVRAVGPRPDTADLRDLSIQLFLPVVDAGTDLGRLADLLGIPEP